MSNSIVKYFKRWISPTPTQLAIRKLKKDRAKEMRRLSNCPFPNLLLGLQARYEQELLQLRAQQLLEENA